jgi:photosystem II stability/assembly factor-like uncharacterized protein
MMIRKLRSKIPLVIALCFFSVAARAQRTEMKLLAPKVGWALAVPGLMRTTDGGMHWKNITPPLPRGEHVTAIFFLDTARGWVLLSNIPSSENEIPRLHLAFTKDSGSTWAIWPITIPRLNPRSYTLGGGGDIYFLDSLHGWMNLSVVSGAAVRLGILVETQDGGRTWKWVASPGHAGRIYFPSINDGWLVGGPGGGQIYATWNSGKSWQQISLEAILNGKPVTCGASGTPHFTDEVHGYLPASCLGGAMVLFATDDAGKSWRTYKVLHDPLAERFGNPLASAVTDSSWIVVKARQSSVALFRIGLGAGQGAVHTRTGAAPGAPPRSGVIALSFAGTLNGWALILYHGTMTKLLATTDGGNTWTDITPRPVWKPLPTTGEKVRRRPHAAPNPSPK